MKLSKSERMEVPGCVVDEVRRRRPAQSIRDDLAPISASQRLQNSIQVEGFAEKANAAVAECDVAAIGMIAAHADVIVISATVVADRSHRVRHILGARIVASPVATPWPGSQRAGR